MSTSIDNLFEHGIDVENRTIYIDAEIDDALTARVLRALNHLNKLASTPIRVYITSIGGDVYDGFALYDAFRESEAKIEMIGTGLIASIAAIIFLAGKSRRMTSTARLMIHPCSAWLDMSAPDLKIETREVEKLEQIRLEILAVHSKRDISFWRKFDRNHYFNAATCLRLGLTTI